MQLSLRLCLLGLLAAILSLQVLASNRLSYNYDDALEARSFNEAVMSTLEYLDARNFDVDDDDTFDARSMYDGEDDEEFFQMRAFPPHPKVKFMPGSVSDPAHQNAIKQAIHHAASQPGNHNWHEVHVTDGLHTSHSDPRMHSTVHVKDAHGNTVHQVLPHGTFPRTHVHLAPGQQWRGHVGRRSLADVEEDEEDFFEARAYPPRPTIKFLPGSVGQGDHAHMQAITHAIHHAAAQPGNHNWHTVHVTDGMHMNQRNDPHMHATVHVKDAHGNTVHQVLPHGTFPRTHVHLAPGQQWNGHTGH